MPKSDYEADLYLNSRWRDAGSLAALGNTYLLLASADLTSAFVVANELANANGYARILISTTNAFWSAPADSGGRRMISNLSQITGPTVTGNLNSGNPIGYWGIADSSTIGAGNLLVYGPIGTPITILNGQTITIPPGALQLFER